MIRLLTHPMSTLSIVACISVGVGAATAQEAPDLERGEKVFRKCKACHQIGEDAKNSTGPMLNNVIGRLAGTAEGFKFGKSLVAAGEAGLIWDEALIAEYIIDPKAFLRTYLDDKKATAKMILKLKKEEDRFAVAAYVATFSDPPLDPESSVADEAATPESDE